ncbi:MAG: flagellar M-ring protein FliF [Candidatus Sericytochromatia bacterium]|nr:flagellar M-ring protein FliF [Candidatus Tanganyikabacteria bacterium]
MNEFLRQIQADLARVWGALTRLQKILFLGVGLGSIIAVVMLIAWAQSPDFQPLYTNLDDTDAGAIIAELQTTNTAYQLSPDGRRISVPGPQVAQLRIQLAQKGLPSGGGQLGYADLFDKGQTFGQTDAVQRMNMRRALQGELARTIKSMAGVDNARVSLAIPEPSIFGEDEETTEPTATVLLKLKAGAKFGSEQARTVVHLVSKSVERLKPANVIVADTTGKNYTSELLLGDEIAALSASQLEVKRGFELDLRKRIQSMLDRVLGVNGAVVQVQSDFDFNQVELNQEIYQPILQTPDGTRSGLIRSQRENVEAYAGRSGMAAGIPGTIANIPIYNASESLGAGVGDYRRTEVTRNYEHNKEIRKQIKPPAELKRLSVSVALNGDIPEDQRLAIQQMVAAAAGVLPQRGDTLVVAAIPFNDAYAKKAAAEIASEDRNAQLLNMLKIIGAVLVGIIALYLLRRGLRSREEELFEHLPMQLDKPGITVSELGVIGEEDRRTHLQREIAKVVKAQPQEVARLVRTWMMEDEG